MMPFMQDLFSLPHQVLQPLCSEIKYKCHSKRIIHVFFKHNIKSSQCFCDTAPGSTCIVTMYLSSPCSFPLFAAIVFLILSLGPSFGSPVFLWVGLPSGQTLLSRFRIGVRMNLQNVFVVYV